MRMPIRRAAGLRLIRNVDAIGGNVGQFKQIIDNIELVDPYTVAIHTKTPQGELWIGMTSLSGNSGMIAG